MKDIGLYIMALLYIAAGVNHFRIPWFYKKIIPPYLPAHDLINKVSGVAEILLGIGLMIPYTRSVSAWGIILLLIAVFPANIYHLQAKGAGMKIPVWGLWLRLPIQFVLIYWAYLYT